MKIDNKYEVLIIRQISCVFLRGIDNSSEHRGKVFIGGNGHINSWRDT